jgi:hypothetical protein
MNESFPRAELGKKGIAFGGQEYAQPEFLFTKLNEIKPSMIEEATRKAREVAIKNVRVVATVEYYLSD